MKRGLKKKGSSLVAVLVICSIILVLATTMIGVATTDVRMRINESKKLQNMYLSESGLDVVYNSILKDCEIAIEYAKNQVNTNNLGGDMSDEVIYNTVNEEFQRNFIQFLWNIPVDADQPNNASNLNSITDDYADYTNNIVPNVDPGRDYRLLFSIKNYKYISNVDDTGLATYSNAFTSANNRPEINIVECVYDSANKKITITVRSSFKNDVGISTTKLENKKVIQTKFNIEAPNYAEILKRTNTNTTENIYPVYKAIAIDGNLKINNDTNISGDIWVKGNEATAREDDQGILYTKYDGGIALGDGITLNTAPYNYYDNTNQLRQIESDIYTAGTFSLSNDVTATLCGDLYSKNTYIGPIRTGVNSGNNNLTLRNMITYNDLAINSLGSNITMENYYGINSKEDGNGTKNNALRKSSCILVNNYNINSSLNITNDAYIMGVAYINTNGQDDGEYYETGESVAIKGNQAKVYTEVLPGYRNSVNLEYYSGVQLVESINNDSSSDAKKDYFNAYKAQYPSALSDGGISINNIYAVGAFVNANNENNDIDNVNTTVNSRRVAYGSNVVTMGSVTDATSALDFYNDAYDSQVTVGSIVDFGQITTSSVSRSQNFYNDAYSSLSKAWRIVLSSDQNETVIIGENDIDDNGNPIKVIKIVDENNDEVSKLNINDNTPNGNIVNAIILANGNVVIKSGINFTGTIIAQGDMEIESGTSATSISYNEQAVLEIAARNSISQYFISGSPVIGSINVPNGDNISVDNSAQGSNGYNTGDVVGKGLWSLIK